LFPLSESAKWFRSVKVKVTHYLTVDESQKEREYFCLIHARALPAHPTYVIVDRLNAFFD